MQDAGWIFAFFPSNMTDELQPMDLTVNSICKGAMRSMRIDQAFDSLLQFRADYFQAKAQNRPLPQFVCDIPSYRDGVVNMLELFNTKFQEHSFKDKLAHTFVTVGLCPILDSNRQPGPQPRFVQYEPRKHGNISRKYGTDLLRGGIGETLVAVESRAEEYAVDVNGEIVTPPIALSLELPKGDEIPEELLPFLYDDDIFADFPDVVQLE